ncbi:MAG: ComF family protein [Halieaceae bacterium]|nr:ComF family protein [Halieaceae bacterium]
MRLQQHSNWLLNTLLPKICRLCQQHSDTDHMLCSFCKDSLVPNSPACIRCGEYLPTSVMQGCPYCTPELFAFDACHAPWKYSEGLRYLIHRWKFVKTTNLTSALADLLLEGLETNPIIDALVPMPLHWRRTWQRGYNQCALLAQRASKELEIPTHSVLSCTMYQAPQHKAAHRHARHLSSKHFHCEQNLKGLRLALIDDVITTGQTAHRAAQCLKTAGAEHVAIWCIAKTPKPGAPCPSTASQFYVMH